MHDELVELMGGEVSELVFAKSGPTVILLAGLQGVGKTTVCAKLAFYLKKLVKIEDALVALSFFCTEKLHILLELIKKKNGLQGKSCMLVAADVYRPAAIDQLKILGEKVVTIMFFVHTRNPFLLLLCPFALK